MRIAAPATIAVTAADVARGFVEVETPVDVAVRSNEPRGHALLFQPVGPQVREAQVSGPDLSLRVAGAGAIALRPAGGGGLWTDRLALRFRFVPAPEVAPGQYAWPLHVALLPP